VVANAATLAVPVANTLAVRLKISKGSPYRLKHGSWTASLAQWEMVPLHNGV